MTIFFYELDEPYGVFSNFSPHGIEMDGRRWPTTEHYFQAQKFAGTPYEEQIRLAATPKQAAEIGRNRERSLRPDWDQVKDDVMRCAVLRKFETHADLAETLLATGEEYIVEQTTDDEYWGCGRDGHGKNVLGHIIMEVRAVLRDKRIMYYDPYVGVTKVAKALTSPRRLYLIHLLLKKGEMSVAELAMALSVTEPTVFSHTDILMHAGIVTVIQRKNSLGIGKMNYYRIQEVPVIIQAFSTLDLPLPLCSDDNMGK